MEGAGDWQDAADVQRRRAGDSSARLATAIPERPRGARALAAMLLAALWRAGSRQSARWQPFVEDVVGRLRVDLNGVVVADTRRGKRVVDDREPSHVYVPCDDVRMDFLRRRPGPLFCEWIGIAHQYDVIAEGRLARRAAWAFSDPLPRMRSLTDCIAFDPRRLCIRQGDGAPANQADKATASARG